MTNTPESVLEFDPAELQFLTPSDRAKALPLSGEILFLATSKGEARTLGYRSAGEHRYVILVKSEGGSARWTVQNVSTVPLPSEQPEQVQDVLSAHRVGSRASFHFSHLGPMSVEQFNQRYGHTDLATWEKSQSS